MSDGRFPPKVPAAPGRLPCSRIRCLFLLLSVMSPTNGNTLKYSIYEEEIPGTVIGNLAEDAQIGAEDDPQSGFRLMSKLNSSLIRVGESEGRLSIGSRIDREQLCRQTSPCLIAFDVVNFSREKFKLIHVEIEVRDINDNSPEFPNPEMFVEISESSALGTRIPLEVAVDADVGENYLQNYSVSANGHFRLEVQTRSEGGTGAELVLIKQLDRESLSELTLELSAQDGGQPPGVGRAQVHVQVLDWNDNSPEFVQKSFLVELKEDAPVGFLLVQLEAVDPDLGLSGQVVYGFSSHLSPEVRQLFAVDATSGRLTLEGAVDYESRTSYQLDVRARDLGPNSIPANCKVTVNILDVNDNAPEIAITPMTSVSSGVAYITEAAAKDSFVALISTSDRDSGSNGQVSCTLYGHDHFKLQQAYANSYMIVTTAALDRERIWEYNLTVVAEDLGSPPYKSIRQYSIRLSDENDNAPSFSKAVYQVSILENNAPGAYITTVVARDPDLGANGQVGYRLVEAQVLGVPVSALVSVDPATGALYALRSLDRERLEEMELRLEASDGGSPQLSSSALIQLRVADQNDNPPVITHPVPSNRTATVLLPSNAPSGYLATRIRARDADEGMNSQLTYGLLRGEPPGFFAANRVTGEIFLNRLLSRDTPTALKIIVAVHDNGRPSLSSTVTVSFVVRPPTSPGSQELVIHSSAQMQRPWDISSIIIMVLGGGCVVLIMAIIGVAATCHKSTKAGKYSDNSFGTKCHISQLEARQHQDDRLMKSSEPDRLNIVDMQPNSSCELSLTNESKDHESDVVVSSIGEEEGVYLLEVDHKVSSTNVENILPVSTLNHGTFHKVSVQQDRGFLQPVQDGFSGKDSGKGDSDFNDSDSDISSDGIRQGNVPLDQRQNGPLPCVEENQMLGSHPEPYYRLASQGTDISKLPPQLKQSYMIAYSTVPTTLLHSTCVKTTSLPHDCPINYTCQHGHLPKSGGLQISQRVLPRKSGRTMIFPHPPEVRHSELTEINSTVHTVPGSRCHENFVKRTISEVATSF